jgi:tRNA nucleotidyltransferase (CCA-adding enzyme)
MSIEEQVLGRVSPDKEYRSFIEGIVDDLLKRLLSEAERMGLEVEILLVGSVAKDTYVLSPDIDIFILFPQEWPRDKLEKDGLELGKRVIDGYEKYAEHPYVHGEIQGVGIDLVPCFKLEDIAEMKSAVDRTPFHLEFVKENLDPEQRDDVRLLKQFMKGAGVYSAEAKVEGFSGYLTELLIIKYGNFRSVLKNATKWTNGTTLWLERKGRTKFKSHMVFYDPVDLKRNVASGLSLDSYAIFIQACKEYLEEERIEFFFPRERSPLEMSDMEEVITLRGTSIVIASFDRPDIIDDNLYPQIRKTQEGLMSLLRERDFMIIDADFHVGERISFVFELLDDVIPRCRRHVGPPVWMDHSERFLDKWENNGLSLPFIDNGRWIVLVEREFTNAVDLLATEAGKAALGSDFKQMKGYQVIGGNDVFAPVMKPVLSALMDKRMNWEI